MLTVIFAFLLIFIKKKFVSFCFHPDSRTSFNISYMSDGSDYSYFLFFWKKNSLFIFGEYFPCIELWDNFLF